MQKYPEADNIQKIRLGINCINQPNFDTIPLSGVQETKVAAKQSQLAGSTGVGSREWGAEEMESAAGRNWEGREDGGTARRAGGAARHDMKKREPGTVAVSLLLCRAPRRAAAAYSPTWWGSTIGAAGLNFSVRYG